MTETCSNCRFPLKTSACEGGCNHRWHCECGSSDPDHEPTILFEVDGWGVSKHANERYMERSLNKPPSVTIETAWQSGIPVGATQFSDDVTARIYPPEECVLLAHGGVIRTTLTPRFHDLSLNTQHLKKCDHCGSFWDPSEQNECNWCEGETPVSRSVKGMDLDGGRYG